MLIGLLFVKRLHGTMMRFLTTLIAAVSIVAAAQLRAQAPRAVKDQQ